MDYKIRIKSKNGTLTLSPRSACKVLDGGLKGFDSPEGELTLGNAAAESGGYPVRRRIRSRSLSVAFEVTDLPMTPYYRDLVMRLSDPREDIEIETFMWGRQRMISVIPDGMPEIVFSGHGDPMRVTMDFTACDPFFRETVPVTALPGSGTALLSFPLTMLGRAGGAVTGMSAIGTVVRVNNPGDEACGFRMKLYGATGPVVKPMVTNGVRYIRPFGTVDVEEEMTIVTEPGNKGVFKNGRSVGFYSDSTFFSLAPGDNLISLSATEGVENAAFEMEFTPLYLGA